MRFSAKHRFADVTARKLRPLADLIRGKTADEALESLRYLPNRGARLIEAVLKSAVGNAEDRGVRAVEDLLVVESRIDGGPIMKRFMPRARGMATPIKKRYAHIVVAVDDGRTAAATAGEQ
jgi:large subunit ribosomal protein L22